MANALVLISLMLISAFAPACAPAAQVPSVGELSKTRPGADAIVIVYSRSGHTAEAGKALADELDADYLRLRGQPGDGDGILSTPAAGSLVDIDPKAVDLSRYQLILLGSPIWYWKPTAHILTFVRTHDFRGKDVVLFYTFEGGVQDQALKRWRARVRGRRGTVIDTFGVDRSQLSPGESVAEGARTLLERRRAGWRQGTKAPSASR